MEATATAATTSATSSPLPVKNPMIPDLNFCAPRKGIKGPSTTDEYEKGLACHQCRQKTVGPAAACKNMIRNRLCKGRICRRCLINRYGEKVEDVLRLENWKCPRCRGVCNCSICMKRRGQTPTGILTPTAKAKGFSSVAEMLLNTNLEEDKNSEVKNTEEASTLSSTYLSIDSSKMVTVSNEVAKQEMEREELQSGIPNETSTEVTKEMVVTNIMEAPMPDEDVDLLLPEGEELKTVADIELHEHDVGPALQFLEFCSAFGKFFNLEKGQPEAILKELTDGNIKQQRMYSFAVHFHKTLLDLLQVEEKHSAIMHSSTTASSWLETLNRFISKSPYVLEVLPEDYLHLGADGYFNLHSSKKITILNFLCDMAIGTEHLRILIDEANENFYEEKKEYQKTLVEMNKKEKDAKQKLKDERALLSLGDATSTENHDIICNLKKEIFDVHEEKLKAREMNSGFKKRRSDAVRTEPVLVHNSGRILWRLGGDSVASHIMLQDIGSFDSPACQDKWYIYDNNQEKELEIVLSRKRRRRSKAPETVDLEGGERVQNELAINLTLLSNAAEGDIN